jgi:hypothetical protein
MKAVLLLKQKLTDGDGDILELVIWKVQMGTNHPKGVRYRLAFIPQGHSQPAVLYNNHHPKGPHKHSDGRESAYIFIDVGRLIEDFQHAVSHWKKSRGD